MAPIHHWQNVFNKKTRGLRPLGRSAASTPDSCPRFARALAYVGVSAPNPGSRPTPKYWAFKPSLLSTFMLPLVTLSLKISYTLNKTGHPEGPRKDRQLSLNFKLKKKKFLPVLLFYFIFWIPIWKLLYARIFRLKSRIDVQKIVKK